MPEPSVSRRRQRRAPPAVGGEEAGPASSARRNELLQIAATCFAEYGFEATTIRNITDRAGILSGSLYHHFDTKEEMLHELVQPWIRETREQFVELSRRPGASEDLLVAMIRALLAKLSHDRDMLKILWGDANFFQRNEQFRYVFDFKQDLVRTWYGVIQEGVRSGGLRQDLDPHIVAPMILTFLIATTQWYNPGGRMDVAAMSDTAVAIVMGGLKA